MQTLWFSLVPYHPVMFKIEIPAFGRAEDNLERAREVWDKMIRGGFHAVSDRP